MQRVGSTFGVEGRKTVKTSIQSWKSVGRL